MVIYRRGNKERNNGHDFAKNTRRRRRRILGIRKRYIIYRSCVNNVYDHRRLPPVRPTVPMYDTAAIKFATTFRYIPSSSTEI